MLIDKSGSVGGIFKVHINQIYKINGPNKNGLASGGDAVTISKFSALVEKGRACAMAQPNVRADRVAQVRASLDEGEIPATSDITSMMINNAVRGKI